MHKFKNILKRRSVSVCLSFCLLFTLTPVNTFAYTTNQLRSHTAVERITSGQKTNDDYMSIETEGKQLRITFKHSQEFDRIVLRLMNNGKSIKKDIYCTEGTAACDTFRESYNFSNIPDGKYYFRIVVQKDSQLDGGLTNYPSYLQGVYVVVKDGTPELQKFNTITKSNAKLTKSVTSKFYTQASMEDLKYQLFGKKGSSTPRSISASKEAQYYETISNQIVSEDDSDYEKIKKIFAYTSENFYYNHFGKATGKRPYDDPYYNLRYFENKSGNDYNAVKGKVALDCDGYAGIFTALTRAQGIPCRIVYGRKITSGSTSSWDTIPDSYFKSNSHTWAEAWVDDRWVIVDPQQGSYNSRGSNGNKTDKKWHKSTIVNYMFFDISGAMLANTHYSRTLPGGNTSISLMRDSAEVSQLKKFLNIKTNGKTNGKRLNSKYSSSKKSTWGTSSTIYTDGFGYVKYINWPEKKLSGSFNLSNFDQLKNVTIYLNSLTSLNTKNCPNLATIYASGNKIKTVNLLASKDLKTADYKNNPLTKAQIYANKRNVTISAVKNGTFSFKYKKTAKKKITVYPKAAIGYKYTGIYNANGKKLSTNKISYSFTPTGKTYKIKFALDPNSYKYYLKEGNNSSLKLYNSAVQKRLKELNYYTKSVNGKFDRATKSAVKSFQKKHGLKQTGAVNEATWKKLFSSKAKKK